MLESLNDFEFSSETKTIIGPRQQNGLVSKQKDDRNSMWKKSVQAKGPIQEFRNQINVKELRPFFKENLQPLKLLQKLLSFSTEKFLTACLSEYSTAKNGSRIIGEAYVP